VNPAAGREKSTTQEKIKKKQSKEKEILCPAARLTPGTEDVLLISE